MPRYTCTGSIAASSALGVVGITAGNAPRRARILEYTLGCDSLPGTEVVLRYTLDRFAASGTFTSTTPNPLDSADAACTTVGGQNWTVNPALGANLDDFALNMRATFRWVAQPGSELVMPATLGAGLFVRNPAGASTGSTSVRGRLIFDE